MNKQNRISAVILVKNSEKRIREVLRPLLRFDEVVVVDNGSEDSTLDIVRTFENTKIYFERFIGFGALKQKAVGFAKNSWVINVDSDEVLSEALVDEILGLELDRESCYSVIRENLYRGRVVKCCGWYPDRNMRLFNKRVMNFNNLEVHESIVRLDGKAPKVINLKNHLTHYSYEKPSDFLEKMERYSTLFAQQSVGKKSSSLPKAILRSFWTFFKNYILQRGFLYGYEGFLISVYNAQVTFWKYIKLYEEQIK